MFEFAGRSKKIQPLNLIPLINVVFLLLIFFLVAGRMDNADILPMNFPVAANGVVIEETALSITLGPEQQILVNDEPVQSLEELEVIIGTSMAHDPQQIITLKADATLPAEAMIRMMRTLQQAGGSNISLVTERRQP